MAEASSMSSDRAVWECKHALPSQAGAGRCVQEEIIGQLERQQWPEHDLFSIRLAMEEALVNAIKHGNQFDASKQVHIACRVFPACVRIEIADEGPGFDPNVLPDPTDPENIDVPSGRGVMLMRSFMSRVEFNECGNRVIMEKDRDCT